jgi:uncharacterized membrane protein
LGRKKRAAREFGEAAASLRRSSLDYDGRRLGDTHLRRPVEVEETPVVSERVVKFVGHELTRRGPLSPALMKLEEERASRLQSRIADAVTGFAGSMSFVYVHVLWFAFWITLPVEKYPFGLLTMIVSLEAIFLSTFVMISQNRADARRQVFADNQYEMIQEEKAQNVELIAQGKRIEDLTASVLALTHEVRTAIGARQD